MLAELAPVTRLGIQRFGGDRTVVWRGKRGLVAELDATHEGTILAILDKRYHPLEKVVVRGTPQPWTKPTDALAKAMKKVPAGVVELHEGWQPYA